MRLVLHQHPFASYCQKVLVGLGELGLPFETQLVDDANARARHAADVWPLGTIPVLRDEDADLVLPESTTIIEYLDRLAPGGPDLVPAEPARALQARLWDRIVDHHLADPMGKIVTDRLRPEDASDAAGVEQAAPWTPPMAYSRSGWTSIAGWPGTRSPWPTAQPPRRCSTAGRCIAGTSPRGPG